MYIYIYIIFYIIYIYIYIYIISIYVMYRLDTVIWHSYWCYFLWSCFPQVALRWSLQRGHCILPKSRLQTMNVGKHKPSLSHHHVYRWYVYSSQSWVVYDIVLPTITITIMELFGLLFHTCGLLLLLCETCLVSWFAGLQGPMEISYWVRWRKRSSLWWGNNGANFWLEILSTIGSNHIVTCFLRF